MSLASMTKTVLPRQAWPAAIGAYLKGRRLYFAIYRRFLRPNSSYLAVAEQNYLTDFPPEWTSVSIERADIEVDLETDYNFNLSEVKYAYSSHTIEHLSDEATRRLFKNVFKSMRNGGVIRIECPDLDRILDDYKCVHNSDRRVTKLLQEKTSTWNLPKIGEIYAQEHMQVLSTIVTYFDRRHNIALPPICTAEEFQEKLRTLTNSQFGDWAVSLMTPEQLHDSHEHRNWFNFSKLQKFLGDAGFTGVVECQAAETRYHFKMNINRNHRSPYSIYVEAIKK